MKSQAVAFLLGFSLTSIVLVFTPGMGKSVARSGNTGDQKLAGFAVSSMDSSAVHARR